MIDLGYLDVEFQHLVFAADLFQLTHVDLPNLLDVYGTALRGTQQVAALYWIMNPNTHPSYLLVDLVIPLGVGSYELSPFGEDEVLKPQSIYHASSSFERESQSLKYDVKVKYQYGYGYLQDGRHGEVLLPCDVV